MLFVTARLVVVGVTTIITYTCVHVLMYDNSEIAIKPGY